MCPTKAQTFRSITLFWKAQMGRSAPLQCFYLFLYCCRICRRITFVFSVQFSIVFVNLRSIYAKDWELNFIVYCDYCLMAAILNSNQEYISQVSTFYIKLSSNELSGNRHATNKYAIERIESQNQFHSECNGDHVCL